MNWEKFNRRHAVPPPTAGREESALRIKAALVACDLWKEKAEGHAGKISGVPIRKVKL
jgi:hypothetical protein